MKIIFIYPYREINGRSLVNDSLTMLEYTSLRFANYLACLGVEIVICSKNGKHDVSDNMTYGDLLSVDTVSGDTVSVDTLIVVDSLDHLHLSASKKYAWLSSSIDDISKRQNAINIIEYDVKIITFQELGGDFEIPYAIMELDSVFENDDHMYEQESYAIVTTNPKHGLQEILKEWDPSLLDLYVVSKTLKNNNGLDNIKIIDPKNCDHMARIIKNAQFYISPKLPDTVFNSFAILSQYYGVPTLSLDYKYNHILHKNNMGGINVKNVKELMDYVHLLSYNNEMKHELSNQATLLRSNLDMEYIFIELSKYLGAEHLAKKS